MTIGGISEKNIDLLNGNILTSLTELALPIMATSLVQTAYNLTDMAWIGMVGSDAVAKQLGVRSHVYLAVLRRCNPGQDGEAR